MNLEELINKLREIEEKQIELKNEMYSLEKSRYDIKTYLEKCTGFDESLIILICGLMSKKEKEEYVPFVYRTISYAFTDATTGIENQYVGIAKRENMTKFIKSKSASETEELFNEKIGYESFFKSSEVQESQDNSSFVYYYKIPDENTRVLITFQCLLNSLRLNLHGYTARISKYDFEDYTYVQNYIKYLFDLQVQNNGRQLTYGEMQKALNDFLELERNKPKQKIKERD